MHLLLEHQEEAEWIAGEVGQLGVKEKGFTGGSHCIATALGFLPIEWGQGWW